MQPSRKWSMQKTMSVVVAAIGCLLMAGKIHADSEPGAIPLLLVVLGIGWYVVARRVDARGG